MKPVFVYGVLPFLQNILKRRELVAAMIEHGVQHDADSSFVALSDNSFEQLIVTEMGIDLFIIHNIVFMIGRRHEQRGKVNGIDSEFLQIIQMVQHALQISAKKIIQLRRSAPRLCPLRVIRRVAIGEPLRHNLVKHRILGPVGHLKQIDLVYVGKLVVVVGGSRAFRPDAVVKEIYIFVAFAHTEGVAESFIFGPDRGFPVIELVVRSRFVHHDIVRCVFPVIFVPG
ncbi:hypothetical protein D3C75_727990 [compost metagenome]